MGPIYFFSTGGCGGKCGPLSFLEALGPFAAPPPAAVEASPRGAGEAVREVAGDTPGEGAGEGPGDGDGNMTGRGAGEGDGSLEETPGMAEDVGSWARPPSSDGTWGAVGSAPPVAAASGCGRFLAAAAGDDSRDTVGGVLPGAIIFFTPYPDAGVSTMNNARFSNSSSCRRKLAFGLAHDRLLRNNLYALVRSIPRLRIKNARMMVADRDTPCWQWTNTE
jgi:hypothetical protein